MKVKKIHHINFLVKDLNTAMQRYQTLLGIDNFIIDDLPKRGVKTARALIGEQWFILVEPLEPESVPGRHLANHGEGFFLISFGVDDVNEASRHAKQVGFNMISEKPRQGLENWLVWDIEASETFNTQIQFCEERIGSK